MTVGTTVTFEIGRRTVVGTVSRLVAGNSKAVVQTPEGEYSLPLVDLAPSSP